MQFLMSCMARSIFRFHEPGAALSRFQYPPPLLNPLGGLSHNSRSSLSVTYMLNEIASWRSLFRQLAWVAFNFARASAGRSMAANIAMMAITTRSSMSVNARDVVMDLDVGVLL